MTKNKQHNLDELQQTVLMDLSYQVTSNTLRMLFETAEGGRFSMQASHILQMNISSTDDPVAGVDVFNASVREISDGGKQDLDDLGYLWRDLHGKIMTYPDSSLFYLLIEGDICVAVICGQYTLEVVSVVT